MDKKEIVSSIIFKMTDDDRKNTRILKRKLISLNTLSLKDFVSAKYDEDKTYNAIKAYLSLCDSSKCNDLIMEQDEKGNNFLHIAINNGFSTKFINRCICLLKYVLEPYELITPFINQVNRVHQTLMHKILYKYLFNYTIARETNIINTITLFKTLLNLGFDYKLDDINGDDILSLIELIHKKAHRIAVKEGLVPLACNIPYQSVKKMVTEMESSIFFLEYTPVFEKLTDNSETNKNTFFTVFEYDSFKLLKKIETSLNDLTMTPTTNLNYNGVIHMIKIAIESGFNVNCKPTIMRHMLNHDFLFSSEEIYFIYSLLCNYGYITYDNDFTEEELIKYKESIKDDNSVKYMDKLKQLYQQQRFISFLTLVLGNRKLKVDDNFILKYNNCYIEFNNLWSKLQNSFGITDDEYFANMVIDDVLEKRKQCLNVVDKGISIDDMISSLVSLFENLNNNIQNAIDNVKIKMLNN